MTDTVFQVGDKVQTNRYFREQGFNHAATVIEIRSTDYVIRYDDEGKRGAGVFQIVGRSAANLRPVTAPTH